MILEINHLYGFDSPSKHDDLATLISESLKELIAPRAPHFPARTLGDIASGPARVLVLCDSRGTKDSDFLYPQSSIVSPWLNKASPDALLGDAARVWRDSRAVDTLYVCQVRPLTMDQGRLARAPLLPFSPVLGPYHAG